MPSSPLARFLPKQCNPQAVRRAVVAPASSPAKVAANSPAKSPAKTNGTSSFAERRAEHITGTSRNGNGRRPATAEQRQGHGGKTTGQRRNSGTAAEKRQDSSGKTTERRQGDDRTAAEKQRSGGRETTGRRRRNSKDTAGQRQDSSGETAERRRNGGRTHRRKKRGPFDSGPLSRRCPAEGDRPHPRSRGAAGRQFTKVSPSLSASMRIGFSRFTSPARIRFERSLTMYRWIVRFTGRAP